MADDHAFRIRLLADTDDIACIQVSDDDSRDLNDFLQTSARAYAGARLARTHVLIAQPRSGAEFVAGYMTLVAASIDTGNQVTLLPARPDSDTSYDAALEVSYPYTTYPALKIARLLIDERFRGQELGSAFVARAAQIASIDICPQVGCRFLVVDSKKNAIPFYERNGFQVLKTSRNLKRDHPLMFIDLATLPHAEAELSDRTARRGGGYMPR